MSGLTWALGTFHTAAVGIALLLLAYPGGSLGVTLGSLSTASGLAIFVALWAWTVFSTGRAIRGLRLIGPDRASSGAYYTRALRWGAFNGVTFFISLVAIIVVNALSLAAPSVQVGAVLSIAAFEGILGSLFAFAIGAVIGLALASLDLVALGVARAMLRVSPAEPTMGGTR